jgi:HlyD family secretion protein
MKRKTLFISIGAVGFIGLASYMIFGGDKIVQHDFVQARTGSITQEVSVTGRVVPASEVQLAFETGGRVDGVYVSVGDVVARGALLASVSASDIRAQLDQAEASLRAEEVALAELRKGARGEQLDVYRSKVSSAEVSAQEAKKVLVQSIQDAYTKSDDALYNRVDQIYTNPRGDSPKLSFSVNDYQLEIELKKDRVLIGAMLEEWGSSLDILSVDADLDVYATEAREHLETMRSYLANAALAVNTASATGSLTAATLSAWKTDLATARTNINTAITTLNTSDASLQSAYTALEIAERELTLAGAEATDEELASQEARIEQMQAQVDLYEAQMRKTKIYAPISGTITAQDAKVGEIVSPNVSLISIISEGDLEMEAFVPEADFAKIDVGDEASVTLDAYGDDTLFDAVISDIDPKETIREGVSTYKTTLQFVGGDDMPRSGMTANITVKTGSREDVLVVPGRAVSLEGGANYVTILVDETTNETEKRSVTVGLRGSDGNIEIIEGLSEGEKVVTFLRTQ